MLHQEITNTLETNEKKKKRENLTKAIENIESNQMEMMKLKTTITEIKKDSRTGRI